VRWYARQLARLECHFEIIQPGKLRTELAAQARHLLSLAKLNQTRSGA
jgi:hypothetical protein